MASNVINGLCRSLRKLIVDCRLIDHEFCYQFSKFMCFQTFKIALADRKRYSISYMAQLTFCHLQRLVLGNIGIHVDMDAFYRFIHNLEVAIKDREKYFSSLRKSFRIGVGGSF